MKRGLKEPTKGVSKKVKVVKGVPKVPKVPKVVKGTKVMPKVVKVVKGVSKKVVKGTKAVPKLLANKIKKTKNCGGANNFIVPYTPFTTINASHINYTPYKPLTRAEPRGSMNYTSSSSLAESNAITEEEQREQKEEKQREQNEERARRLEKIKEHFDKLAKEDEELERKQGLFKKLYERFLAKVGLEHEDEYYLPVRKRR
jgi:flagellar biosynthesis GTPase FlhF